ncbi:MAG: ferredoxin [Limisphaerales bacterium]|jgi:ferredoxin
MTFVITSACIDVMDKSCIEVCPVDCIFAEDSDRMCFIEPNDCIDCDACEAACPVGAIFRDSEVPKQATKFTELNALWFSDKSTVRAQVDDWAENGPNIV